MLVDWTNQNETRFGNDVMLAQHDAAGSDLFLDDGLAHILDVYPRENLDIWTFGAEGEGVNTSLRGRAPKLSGAEIVEAVKNGHIWLNMRRANFDVPELKPIADAIYDSLEDATERKMRGKKQLWMYPKTESLAPSEFIEDIVHMSREEELPYRKAFDDAATVYELTPGMGLTWPQFMPHRVENANCLNVSLSCEYQTLGSFLQANAIYTNKLLRKTTPLSPVVRNAFGPGVVAKAAFARAHKAIARTGPRTSPTPITFELDTGSESYVRPLY